MGGPAWTVNRTVRKMRTRALRGCPKPRYPTVSRSCKGRNTIRTPPLGRPTPLPWNERDPGGRGHRNTRHPPGLPMRGAGSGAAGATETVVPRGGTEQQPEALRPFKWPGIVGEGLEE